MFSKSDRKKGHPGLAIALGALAVVGAFSIFNTGKRWMSDKASRMMCMVKGTVNKKSDTLDFCD